MARAEETLHFKIHGMDCAEEVGALKREVGPLVGGEHLLTFDILQGKMTVLTADSGTSEIVVRGVANAGLRAEVWSEDVTEPERAGFWLRWSRTILTAGSGIFLLAGFFTHVVLAGSIRAALGSDVAGSDHRVPVVAAVLYSISILAGVWQVLPRAWASARRLRPDMNLLMTVAIAGAVGIGEWMEGSTVAFLFALSLVLEAWSVGRARRAVEALLDLSPQTVRLLGSNGAEKEVSPDQVSIGSRFVVKPGERIPLDGKIVRGTSAVNQAPITGESAPVAKKPTDPVFAGTVNGDGALEVESTKAAGDTTLAHIVRMVGDAQSRRAPAEQWVEGFARWYTPTVLALAVVLAIVPPLFAGEWSDWFYRALVLLVIACPCALVISTPVSIVAALTAAARQGVLIKGGAHVEAPARLRAIAFDKTGTLTEGRPSVVEIVPLNGHDEREVLERAVAMEGRSDHPLARAITTYAAAKGVTPAPAEDFQLVQGKGATALFDGRRFWLGSHKYLEERGQETTEVHKRLEEMSAVGRTVVVVGNEAHVCGLIALADAVRPHIRETLDELRAAGIRSIVMLTGDNEGTARAIGRDAGVEDVRAELLPQDKVAAVEALVAQYGSVAMVGDGVNDAPAMGRATVGIAMGAAGSDAAIETADIALMSDDLSRLPWLLRHSRRALAIIRQNIGFSLVVKAAFVVLTVAGAASLWAAIAADTGASLLVIFNGLRLLHKQP